MSKLIEKKTGFKKITAHKKKKQKKKKVSNVKLNRIKKTKVRVQPVKKKKKIPMSIGIKMTENERETGEEKEIPTIQIDQDLQLAEQSTRKNESTSSLEQSQSCSVSDPVQNEQHTEVPSQIGKEVNTAESQVDEGKQEAKESARTFTGKSPTVKISHENGNSLIEKSGVWSANL